MSCEVTQTTKAAKESAPGDWLELARLRQIVGVACADQRDAPDLHRVFLIMSGGSHATAVMLAMAVKWDARMRSRGDGWWYKSDSSWGDEAGLSPYEARTGRALLAKCGLKCDSRPAPGGRNTWHYTIDQAAFWASFAAALRLSVEAVQGVINTLKSQMKQIKILEGTVEDFSRDPSKILNRPLKNSEGTVQQSASVYQPVITTGTTTDQSTERQSSSRACAHEGAPEAPGETTTTTHAPVNMQEMLHENGKGQDAEKAPAPSGDTATAPPTPPPSSAPPPSPGALADDALWRAYVAGGGIDAVPVSAFGPYADAWLRLVRAGATPGEVERMTRDRLHGRAPDKPYRFVFLPDDLAEWRRGRRRPVDVMRDEGSRYMTGEFAAFFANHRNQTAQPALGG